ncbi:hypothetical protein [Dasania marina]|uniref:hypothetical protein n=1 Tax=Dasania marina TaxID=471499 RepID=UPI0030D95B63|tara:strand:+ start:22334 stop:22879 length:546 start_codon:yes stop_codon:yes gene_type:complete
MQIDIIDTVLPNYRYGESVVSNSGYKVKENITARRVDTSSNGQVNDTFDQANMDIMPAVSARVGVYKKLSGSFQLLQKWQGLVLSIDEDKEEFDAEIADKTDPANPLEKVTISFDELSISDLSILREGAVFYWTIGYGVDSSGTKEKKSLLRISRLKGFSTSDIAKSESKADKLLELFGVN